MINIGRGESEILSVPEGPAIVPVVGPPVRRAEAHGDLEDLRVHDVSHHPEETCRKQTRGFEGNWQETGRRRRELQGK